MLGVKIIRRLIEDQDVRILQEEFRQQYLRSLSARKLINAPLQAHVAQSEPSCDLLDARVDRVIAARLQEVLDIADILQQTLHLLGRRLTHLIIGREHLFLLLHHRVECRAQRLTNRHARHERGMLVEIADGGASRPFHGTGIRRQLPRQNGEERRLSLAVRADQGDMLALEQSEGNIFKNLTSAIAVRYMLYIQNTHGFSLSKKTAAEGISPQQRSYHHQWSERRDLNPRPLPPQGSALPNCATSRTNAIITRS